MFKFHTSFFRNVGHTVGYTSVLTLLVLAFSSHAASPRPIMGTEIDPEMGVLIRKEKARQQTLNNDQKTQIENDACGTISINSHSQPHSNVRPGRQNVTVITGPVVNAANCR